MADMCSDLLVLELGAGSPAAAELGMLLADAGASVTKIEPPEGDRLRRALPSGWLVWNRGKGSQVVDLRNEAGRRELRGLAAEADVVIEAFETGRADDWGIGYETLQQSNPGLVYCSVKGFGSVGGYARLKGYDGVVQAKAGLFGRGGFAFRPGPIFNGSLVASNGAAQMGLGGIMAALMVRDRTGRGQRVEATLFQGLNPCDYFMSYLFQLTQAAHARAAAEGREAIPVAQSASGSGATRYGVTGSTRDGRWLTFSPQLPHQARALMDVLGLAEMTKDPRFSNLPEFPTAEDARAWEEAVWERLKEKDHDDWVARGLAHPDLPFDSVLSAEQALDHPQVRHNGLVQVIDDPEVGPIEEFGFLASFTNTPLSNGASAPALGAGRRRPRTSAVSTAPTILATPPRSAELPDHPLRGVTILEFGYFYAMPYGITLAAALGARVIKIEDLAGDPMRWSFGPPEWGSAHVMEGKESIALDLRVPAGREVLTRLVAKADAFVLGFRPGVAERLGVDYEQVRRIKPDIVYLHAAGYGTSGPYAHRPIYAGVAGALAGSLHRQAAYWLDSGLSKELSALEAQAVIAPRMANITDGDANAALGAFSALMLALRHQRRTGEGQFVSTSMIGGNVLCYSDDFNRYQGKPPVPQADPEQFGLAATYRLYEAAEGWIFFACPTDREFAAAMGAADRPELASDPRFADGEARRRNDESLCAELTALFATRPAAEWESILTAAGAGAAEVAEAGQAAVTSTDPVLRQMGLVVEVEHPTLGPLWRYAPPVEMAATPGVVAPGCVFAQHTRSIMEELGFDEAAVSALAADRVIAVAD